jgi:hypothetical protein
MSLIATAASRRRSSESSAPNSNALTRAMSADGDPSSGTTHVCSSPVTKRLREAVGGFSFSVIICQQRKDRATSDVFGAAWMARLSCRSGYVASKSVSIVRRRTGSKVWCYRATKYIVCNGADAIHRRNAYQRVPRPRNRSL